MASQGDSNMPVTLPQTLSGVAALALIAAWSPTALAQLPETQAYVGCDDIQLATVDPDTNTSQDGYDKLPQALRVETQKTTRILQGQPANDVIGTSDANEACWARLDGVWQDDTRIKFDDSVEISNWAGDQPKLKNLAHGNYTDTDLVVILPGADLAREITVIDAFNNELRTTFVSSDDRPLSEVLKIRGPRKVYTAEEDSGLGTELILDVDINGFVRLRLNNTVFRRPSPGLIASFDNKDFDIDAPFIYNSNLDNVVASRSGYDISTADPFDLIGTGKKEVFKEVFGRQYRILEKRSVPLGFDLVPATDQGMLYSRTFSRTENELQMAISAAFGGKARIGVNSNLIPGPSVSAGIDVTASIAKNMRDNQYSSRAMGNSMTKKYAIIVDHPFIELSNDFRAAIEDARRYGDEDDRYYQDIVTKFGTHYPYAVTYGANAELSVELSEEETYERLDIGASVRVEGEIEAVKGAVSGYASVAAEYGTAKTEMSGSERSMFRAVGGNGSWDEKGYSAGERAAPILLDLRGLDQLLNPLNYPGQPEVYEDVRTKLRAKIKDYLDLRAVGLSEWPIYSTTLEGDYYTDAYPALIFGFKPKTYAQSDMFVRSVNGLSWVEYQNAFLSEEDREALKKTDKPFLLTRDESGAYKPGLTPERAYRLANAQAISRVETDRATLQNRLKGDVSWTALPDGSVMLDGHSKDENAEPIILRRWIEEDDLQTADAHRLTGGWRSADWPGLVVLSIDQDHEFTHLAIAEEDGTPATLRCMTEQLIDEDEAKNRKQLAGFSRLLFRSTDPLEGRYQLNIVQWTIGALFYSAAVKAQTEEVTTPEKAQAVELLDCLFSDDSPLGQAPIAVWDDDPEALLTHAPTLPILRLLEDGALNLHFAEPLDGFAFNSDDGTNIYDEALWQPVGEELRFTPLPAREADELRANYQQIIADLESAIEP